MSKFYTNFYVRGDNLYVREIVDGVRSKYKTKIEPKLYVVGLEGESEFKTLQGKPLKEVSFEKVSDANAFIRQYRGMDKFKVYGFPRFGFARVNELYPGEVVYDQNLIRSMFIDIETMVEFCTRGDDFEIPLASGEPKKFRDLIKLENWRDIEVIDNGNEVRLEDSSFYGQGFPNMETANCAVNCLTIGFKGKYITFGLGSTDGHEPDTKYVSCVDEEDLLTRFMETYQKIQPDVITGWNNGFFDMPYLYKRLGIVLGEHTANSLSPWGFVEYDTVEVKGQEKETIRIAGVEILDYLDLYQKFTYTMRESYKLDHIAEVELGERKVEYNGSFRDFYKNDYQKFVYYNTHDVRLVYNLDQKMQLINLACETAYIAKVNYLDVYRNVRVLDNLINNYVTARGYQVHADFDRSDTGQFEGAFVKDPIAGMHDWVVSMDLTSMYPSIIMQYNMSPETLLPEREFIPLNADDVINNTEKFQRAQAKAKELDACLCSNGSMYSKAQKGLIPEIVEKMFDMRKTQKKIMLGYESDLEKIKEEKKRRGLT